MMMNANAYAMKRCVDHLCYGEDTFIRNIVLLRPKTERDIYLKKCCWTRN